VSPKPYVSANRTVAAQTVPAVRAPAASSAKPATVKSPKNERLAARSPNQSESGPATGPSSPPKRFMMPLRLAASAVLMPNFCT
jgi:hypothetical protein